MNAVDVGRTSASSQTSQHMGELKQGRSPLCVQNVGNSVSTLSTCERTQRGETTRVSYMWKIVYSEPYPTKHREPHTGRSHMNAVNVGNISVTSHSSRAQSQRTHTGERPCEWAQCQRALSLSQPPLCGSDPTQKKSAANVMNVEDISLCSQGLFYIRINTQGANMHMWESL